MHNFKFLKNNYFSIKTFFLDSLVLQWLLSHPKTKSTDDYS